MIKYYKYMSYLLRHKWFVFVECHKAGIIWRGLVHDMSKFKPSELVPYMNFFYVDKKKNHDAFKMAWLEHQKINKHHWQWWLLTNDDGTVKALEMPEEYVLEMVCDWKGAGKAQGFTEEDECQSWYVANKDKMTLHKKTRKKVETLLFLGE